MITREFRELIEFLDETPEIVRQLTASLSDEEKKYKPNHDEFSALEHVCHLRDIEQEGYAVRIERLLTEDKPLLKDLDGSRLAIERNYNRQVFPFALTEFTLARLENINTLRAVSSDDLESTGVLEFVGEITLGELLRLMRDHDQSHRDELQSLCERCVRRQDQQNARM